MARPSIYSEELADEICHLLVEGNSLVTICNRDDMPDYSTVCRWLAQDREGFCKKYARARELQAMTRADRLWTIAETEEDVNRARLMIDVGKFEAVKLLPKVYGDRTIQEQSGSVEHKHTLDKDGVKALFDELDRRL